MLPSQVKRNPEGIVAKRKFDPYRIDNAKWYKIRNRNYPQREREISRAGTLYRSQLALLERAAHQQPMSLSKRSSFLPTLPRS